MVALAGHSAAEQPGRDTAGSDNAALVAALRTASHTESGSGPLIGAPLRLPPHTAGAPVQPWIASADEAPDKRRDSILQVIEAAVVPRVLLARRATLPARQDTAAVAPMVTHIVPGESQIAELVTLVLGANPDAAEFFVAWMQAGGTPVEQLYLDLLTPAARRLGDMWADDTCSFSDVTIGVWRLQRILHALSPAFQPALERHDPRRRILLAPVAGEQHTFGLVMVGEFFRRAGWEVQDEISTPPEELPDIVRADWFAIAGFTLSTATQADILAASIRAIRRASRNPAIGIMVGGPAFLEDPALAARVGADAMASDGRQAALQAETLHAMMVQPA